MPQMRPCLLQSNAHPSVPSKNMAVRQAIQLHCLINRTLCLTFTPLSSIKNHSNTFSDMPCQNVFFDLFIITIMLDHAYSDMKKMKPKPQLTTIPASG